MEFLFERKFSDLFRKFFLFNIRWYLETRGNPWWSDILPFFFRVPFLPSNSAFYFYLLEIKDFLAKCARGWFFFDKDFKSKWLKINSPHVVCQLRVFLHYIFLSCVPWFTQSVACKYRCLTTYQSIYICFPFPNHPLDHPLDGEW
jgi:hypothetical protein